MPVPNTFANATATIPLSQLDANFATTITLGNTAIQLGNTVTTLNNMTLANVNISSGIVTITNATVTTANVTTANIATAQIANVTVSGTGTFAAGSNTAPSITTSGDTNTGIFFPAADTIAFTEGGVESMRIDASGRVGIGTDSPATTLHLKAAVCNVRLEDADTSAYANVGVDNSGSMYLQADPANSQASSTMYFSIDGTERMRIDSAGNLGLGVTPSAWNLFKALEIGRVGNSFAARPDASQLNIGANWYYASGDKYANTGASSMYEQASGKHTWYNAPSGTAGNAITFTQAMTLDASGNLALGTTSAGTRLVLATSDADTAGQLRFARSVDTTYFWEIGRDNNTSGAFIFSNAAGGAKTERARFTSGGDLLVGKTAANVGVDGCEVGTNYLAVSRPAAPPLIVNRNTDDGTLVSFRQATVEEGTISVSGNTVSYNPFLGSHAGAFADWSRPEVKIGTIFETINELIDYKVVAIEVEDVPKRISYNGNGAVGTTATVEYEGQEYTGIIENERGQERDFNKHVKVKINDTPDSKAVYGVFVGWNTDPSNDGGVYNDMLIGAVGNYVIRMASGQTPEIGDLVKADGTGCAIVQEDDIVRTKTVGKITNTIPQLTYEDGSFLVACVLYCG
jgi:hypothetical protein